MSKLGRKQLGRVPVLVDRAIYENFKKYSNHVGASVSGVIREALGDWYSTVGEARMEAISDVAMASTNLLAQKVADVIEFPLATAN